MSLYSLQGAEPRELPFTIIMIDDVYVNGELRYFKGFLRTDPAQFENWEITAAGYVAAPDKPDALPGHVVVWKDGKWTQQIAVSIGDLPLLGTLA